MSGLPPRRTTTAASTMRTFEGGCGGRRRHSVSGRIRLPPSPPIGRTFAMDLIVVRSAGVIVSSAASDASRTGSATESSAPHSSRMTLSRCASASTTTASAAMTPRASLTVGTRSSTARMSSTVSTCTGAGGWGGWHLAELGQTLWTAAQPPAPHRNPSARSAPGS